MMKLLLLPVVVCILESVNAIGSKLTNLDDAKAHITEPETDHHADSTYKVLTDENFEHDT